MTFIDSQVCPFCQTEIAVDATACPGCQADIGIQIHGRANGVKQPHQVKARSWVFHGLGIVGIVFMLGAILSGASDWWLGLVVAAFCFALGVFFGKVAHGEQKWFTTQD